MNKKRGSHVGVVISFVVFITFLIFMFLIIQPSLSIGAEKQTVLESIEINFLDYLSSNLTSASVNDDLATGASCVQFNNFASGNGVINDGDKLIVKNSNGNILGYDWISGNLNIDKFTNEENFFKVYSSTTIQSEGSSPSGCAVVSGGEYSFGLIKTEKRIFEKNILDAFSLYQTNYSLLKQNIDFAGDFGFDFVHDNGTIISTGEPSQTVGIYTKRVSFNYLNTNLDSQTGSLIIKTW